MYAHVYMLWIFSSTTFFHGAWVANVAAVRCSSLLTKESQVFTMWNLVKDFTALWRSYLQKSSKIQYHHKTALESSGECITHLISRRFLGRQNLARRCRLGLYSRPCLYTSWTRHPRGLAQYGLKRKTLTYKLKKQLFSVSRFSGKCGCIQCMEKEESATLILCHCTLLLWGAKTK